ncbi:MAG: precorrin-8X methylmutase [Spirochaetaceae bacterium]|jgi:precorrin-8X/cobalt-precorrin-8 methylmutase|nr:precorrin-8X methylmutase [Spirochaetaceae bacterium]
MIKKERQYLEPDEIYKRSFAIINEEYGDYKVEEKEMLIRTRIAHTTADVEFSKTFSFHKDAISAGIKAIQNGKNIFTDVSMVSSGIRPRIPNAYAGELMCFLYDEEISGEARKRGTTKSAAAITKGVPFYENGIVAIGNAPTALFELIDLIKEGKANPALIVGVPVGFVGAAESKLELMELDVPFITNPDRRGGSPIAAAIVNGIITLAGRNL